MIYPILIVAAGGALIYWYKRWQKIPVAERTQFARQSMLWAAVVVVLGLVLSGRAHWLMGVLAALVAVAVRVAQLAQFLPLFKKIFGDDAHAEKSTKGQPSSTNQAMSRQQAAELLGVDVTASTDEIRLAHKKLMQKIHPDRGGSDALAKQINLAKDLLLK